MASGHVNRIKRPNTWLHRPSLQNVKKALANPEPSTHGTNWTNRAGPAISVPEGGPEVAGPRQNDGIDPKRTFGFPLIGKTGKAMYGGPCSLSLKVQSWA
jgi:hypothetical protein